MEEKFGSDWIKKFLEGKVVKLSDLKVFFTIKNKEKTVKKTAISDNEYVFELEESIYKVKLSPIGTSTTMYKIEEVTYENS